jgi:hypothetical protein
MNGSSESIYPEFLRTGLGKLHTLGVGRELAGLFTALEHFRLEIHEQEGVPGILEVTERYVRGLNLFSGAAFHLVNPEDFSFELALCRPEEDRTFMDEGVRAEMRAGRFAWALRQTAPVMFDVQVGTRQERGMFHSMGIARQMVGMFFGLLRRERNTSQEVTFSLLSVLLGTCADAVAATRRAAELKSEIHALSGLLPICAWCKNIRDDRGYWKQIESYIETHTEAVFSHGMCPECAKKFMESLASEPS